MSERTDVTAVLIAHAEGPIAGLSLHSLVDAVTVAREAGLVVETLIVLDTPDAATREAFSEATDDGLRCVEVAYADQGAARNHAVTLAAGDYVAFLDGDDLWTENWLLDAHRMCTTDPGRVIAHPALNWSFGAEGNHSFTADQLEPGFEATHLRLYNYWDALCMAPRQVHLAHPYGPRALDDGYAYEDWHWNMETLAAGCVHRVVPETIHFKRRRPGSQQRKAGANRSLPRPSRLHDYDWSAI